MAVGTNPTLFGKEVLRMEHILHFLVLFTVLYIIREIKKK